MKVIAKFSDKIGITDFIIEFILEKLIFWKSTRDSLKRKDDFFVNTNDYIGLQIVAHDLYEKRELKSLAKFLVPLYPILSQGIGLDVGANIGNHTRFLAPLLLQIEAFEPNPEILPLLKLNTENIPNIKIHEIGLSDSKSKMLLYINSENIGGSSVVKGRGVFNRITEIQLMPLDSLSINCEKLQLIKLDVEGHEYEALLGGQETIQISMPLILLEQFPADFVESNNESIALLSKLGYKFTWMAHDSIKKNRIKKRVKKILNLLIRRETTYFLTGSKVPIGHYPMLIAVPPRFLKLLNLD